MKSPQHLLVFRFSALGDVAMTVPVVKSLLQQYPGLHVTYVSNAFVAPLFTGIDRLHFHAADLKGRHNGIKGLFSLYRELNRAYNFDAIADLHNVLRTKILRFFFTTSLKKIAVIDKGRKEKKQLTRKEDKVFKPLRSTIQRYADVFAALGLPVQLHQNLESIRHNSLPHKCNVSPGESQSHTEHVHTEHSFTHFNKSNFQTTEYPKLQANHSAQANSDNPVNPAQKEFTDEPPFTSATGDLHAPDFGNQAAPGNQPASGNQAASSNSAEDTSEIKRPHLTNPGQQDQSSQNHQSSSGPKPQETFQNSSDPKHQETLDISQGPHISSSSNPASLSVPNPAPSTVSNSAPSTASIAVPLTASNSAPAPVPGSAPSIASNPASSSVPNPASSSVPNSASSSVPNSASLSVPNSAPSTASNQNPPLPSAAYPHVSTPSNPDALPLSNTKVNTNDSPSSSNLNDPTSSSDLNDPASSNLNNPVSSFDFNNLISSSSNFNVPTSSSELNEPSSKSNTKDSSLASGSSDPSLTSGLNDLSLPPGSNSSFLIGIAPFAQHAEKMYPHEKMKQVLSLLLQHQNIKVLLFGGGKSEVSLLQQWEQDMPGLESVAGKMSFQEELKLITQLDLMVSMDSANMHLASLSGVPVISIWGSTHPFAGFYGWGQSPDDAIQVDLYCRPCSVFGNRPCFRGDLACMNSISPIVVYNKIIEKVHKQATKKQ